MRWEQHGNLSSHWTIGLSNRWFTIALVGLAIAQLFLVNVVPPSEDELYYWAWSKALSPSYYDHPPMVAYLIFLSSKFFGQSLIGVRFFAVLFSIAILLILKVLSDGKNFLTYLLFTPLVLFGGILMTPDAPFLFFWTLYILWLITTNRVLSDWSVDPIARVYRSAPISYFRWILGGIILGLGILSKYTMFLALPCTLIVLFSRYRFNAWFMGFLAQCLTAILFVLPILFFNYQNSFSPLKYQWAHAMTGGNPGHFWQFVGGQILLLGALPFLVLPWLLAQFSEIRNNFKLHVCLVFFLTPFLFILVQALRAQLEANWGVMCYISFWPLAQWLYSNTSFKSQARVFTFICFLPALIVSFLLIVHLFKPIEYLSPEKDRVGKFKSLFALSKTIAHDLRSNNRLNTVFATNYQWVSYLRFEQLKAEQLVSDSKPSHFTVQPQDPCKNPTILFLADSAQIPQSLNCFSEHSLLREYPLVIRNKEMSRFFLFELGH